MGYNLHFDKLGRNGHNVDIFVESFTKSEMFKIQKYLMSRDWEWWADEETKQGAIEVGWECFPFTITKVD